MDETSPADDGEGHEDFVDVVVNPPADAQATEPIQQGHRLLDHPAISIQPFQERLSA
ncbi:hypothetical protein ACFYY8_28185 [Streptosporangium sp. NPDC001559]|uniref:hypothetical protein n=1 Tax=Streptosporangium sp. NPDC001559 TaxID=3366187 RepID=UPI0036E07121